MEKETKWIVIPWKKNGTTYIFSDKEDALRKYNEMSDSLKSDERLEFVREEIERETIDFPTPPADTVEGEKV